MKKKIIPWDDKMTRVVQIIKQKVYNLLSLTLSKDGMPFIVETYAYNEIWVAVLLQKHPKREEVCMYGYVSF